MVLERMESETPKSNLFHPNSRRLHVMLLLMFGFFCASYMRSNIGMTMTCIVNSTAVAIETAKSHEDPSKSFNSSLIPEQCQHEGIEEEGGVIVNDYGGTLVWSQSVQNRLFAATFWGSLFTIIPAGYFADRTSAKNLFLFSIINYSICSILFPLLAIHTSPWIAFASRVIMGFGEGLIVPAANKLITRWVPNQEKSTAASIFTMGNQFAGGIGIPIVAGFCASRFRWPGVYYFCGGVGIIWCIIWSLVVTNAPEKAKAMSTKERTFLRENIDNVQKSSLRKEHKIPWGKIFTSLPVISCFVSIFGVNMVVVLLQAYQPTFMKEVLYLKLVDNGLYSAAPYIVQIVSKLTWSISIDHLKATGKISNTWACKISQIFATVTIGTFLILITHFADCTRPEITLLMFCAIGIGFSTAISGFYTSLLSLAPAYVGIISSLCQFVGVVGMLVPPFLVSQFRIYGTLEEWQKIFYIVSIYTILSGIFFLIFGKGEVLPWGRGEQSEKLNPKKEEIEENVQKLEITLEQ
ncbi:hypothetical protein FO519_006376 [Halicephalobus sp. NKZ332]|nr:hypothetical protein FO519_006376 [Halicephalobus sp. NKZ332]